MNRGADGLAPFGLLHWCNVRIIEGIQGSLGLEVVGFLSSLRFTLALVSSFKGKPSLLFIFNEEGETQVLGKTLSACTFLTPWLESCWETLSGCSCCLTLIWEDGLWVRIAVSSETGMHWMFPGMTWCLSARHHPHWILNEHVRECHGGFLGLMEGGWLTFTGFRGISLGDLIWKPTCPSREVSIATSFFTNRWRLRWRLLGTVFWRSWGCLRTQLAGQGRGVALPTSRGHLVWQPP